MKKEMLINVLQPEECRIAILEDGVLEELYVERTSQESYVGNVYKGKIVNIEPSIQAAFVDFGIGRNGFLHVSDVDPAYYKHLAVRNGAGHGRPPRQDDRPRGRHDERRGPHREDDRPPRREEHRQEPPRGRRDERRPRMEEEYDDGVSGRRNPPVSPPPLPRDEPRPAMDDGFGTGLFDDTMPTPAHTPAPRHHHDDDPYAGLASLVPDMPPPLPQPPRRHREERPVEEEPRGHRRHGGRHEQHHRDVEEPVAHHQPPPLPPHKKEEPKKVEPKKEEPSSGFGAGIDIWGDDLPPPYMPGAERRTGPDDDFTFDDGPGAVDMENDDDGESSNDFNDDESDGDDEGGENGEGESENGEPRQRRGGRRPQFQRGRHRGRDGDGHQKPLIQDIFKRGQEVIVQVIKEGIGTKGPTLSTYISVAGRYLVLMPGLSRVGVSRKIDDAEQRHRLRDILAELRPPQGLGFIIRTAGTDRNKKELQNDLNYLLRIWQVVVKRIKAQKGPGAIYQESDMITRTIRDTFTADVDSIWIDEPVAYQHAHEFLQAVMPRYASRLKQYEQVEPLFHKYALDGEIAKIQHKKLPLPGGGSIVIDQTEALVAIDVNSGSFRADSNNAEETAYQINLAAAREIARQLRLRDLGGVIVNDFIDMKDDKHRRSVEKAMREAVKRDRARTKVLRISQFGLIEMTRQRIRPSLKRSVFQECPHCNSQGHVKTAESMSIEAMRMIQLAASKELIRRVEVKVHWAVAEYLVNRSRRQIAQLEDKGNMQVLVTALRDVSPERLDFTCYDANGSEAQLQPIAAAPPLRQHHDRGRGRRR
jgi:ribonuclease E